MPRMPKLGASHGHQEYQGHREMPWIIMASWGVEGGKKGEKIIEKWAHGDIDIIDDIPSSKLTSDPENNQFLIYQRGRWYSGNDVLQ